MIVPTHTHKKKNDKSKKYQTSQKTLDWPKWVIRKPIQTTTSSKAEFPPQKRSQKTAELKENNNKHQIVSHYRLLLLEMFH